MTKFLNSNKFDTYNFNFLIFVGSDSFGLFSLV